MNQINYRKSLGYHTGYNHCSAFVSNAWSLWVWSVMNRTVSKHIIKQDVIMKDSITKSLYYCLRYKFFG